MSARANRLGGRCSGNRTGVLAVGCGNPRPGGCIAQWDAIRYAKDMAQLVTRIDEALARDVDELVASGIVASRSEAVRLGLIELLRRVRREQVGSAIVAGYRAVPQTEAELGWADTATVRMIGDEPW